MVSYTLAMETCLRGGQWNTSLEVLNEMTMRGVRLDSKACLTAIDVSTVYRTDASLDHESCVDLSTSLTMRIA